MNHVQHRFDPQPHLTILHLSDVHATFCEPLYGQIDGLHRLRTAVDYALAAGLTPEAVVVSGDLIQSGHADAYPLLRAEFDRIEAAFGVVVVAALGNHDDPGRYRAEFKDTRPRYGTVELPEARIIVLDSGDGDIDDEQLTWLEDELRIRRPFGSVLVMHHPPLPSPLPALAARGLGQPERLRMVLAGSDVRAILTGHYHHPMSGHFAGIPVWVGPALSYQQIMNAGPDWVAGQDTGMFSIVTITDDALIAAPVSLAESARLFTVPAGFATHAAGRGPS